MTIPPANHSSNGQEARAEPQRRDMGSRDCRSPPAVHAAARILRRLHAATRRFLRGRFNANTAVAVFGLTMIGVIWAAAIVHVQTELRDTVDGAIRQNSNLAKALEGHTVRTLKGVDTTLLLLKHEYARLGAQTRIAAYMNSGIIDGELFLNINIADEHGNVLLSSETLRPANLANHEYFRIHRLRGTGAPYIGRPAQDRFSLTWSIPVSRRIDKPDGSFGGVVTAMVDPDYFTAFYKQADLGARGLVDLVGLDGISRARQAGMVSKFGQDLTGSSLLAAQAASANGSFLSTGRTEGIARYMSYRTLADYPLVVAVGASRDEVLADFFLGRRQYYLSAGLVSAAIALFAALLMAALARQRRALQALANSETQFRATFNQAAIGIAHIAMDGGLLQVNQKLCDMLGFTRQELLALKSHQLEPAETRAKYTVHRARLVAGAISTFAAERPLKRRDGSLIWTNRTVSLVRDADGMPQYFISVVEDITDRRASEQRFHATFEQAAVGLSHIAIDDQRHLLVNQKLCDMLGYTRDELLAMRTSDIHHPGELEQCGNLRQRLLAGETDTGTGEVRYICKNGKVIWVNRTLSLVRDDAGRPLYFMRVTEDISERKEVEQQFRTTYEQGAVGIAHVAPDGRYLRANAHLCRIVGYRESELLQMTFREITHPDDIEEGEDVLRSLYDGETDTGSVEKRYLHRDGSVVWANLSLAVVRGADHQAKYHISLVTDITSRKIQEQKIARLNRIRAVLGGINALIVRVRNREALFREACKIAVECGNFGVAWIGMLDPETLDVTPVASAGLELGLVASEARTARPELPNGQGVVGRAIRERHAVFDNDISRHLDVGGGRRQLAMQLGYRSIIALPIMVQERVVGNIALYSKEKGYFNEEELRLLNQLAGDISFALEHIDQAEKLEHLAYHDALTGLPNRVLFQDLLKQAVAQTRRSHGIAGVLFLDLDGFKVINDTLGHIVGDKLLKLAAGRLLECVREGDAVARFGGDEFAVMLADLAAPQDASVVAQKMLDAFAVPFELEGNETYISTSIGISLYPFDSENVDALIKNADAAMYGAKAAGRNNYQFYIAEMNRNASKKMQLGTRLRRALERQEFVLHYQPKVDLGSGQIVGVEALLRWQPPDEALVQPAEFIPLLEETGLIVQVGEWVLRTACAQIAAWMAAGIEPVPVAVNLSARQFQQSGLETLIRGVVEEAGVDPRWIELEITESMLVQNPDSAIAVLRNLKALGIRVSVDDFGTGYSSLSYLKRFPLDALKVDRSFVRDVPSDTDDTAIARAVITMAHSLGLKVIAEGVETAEQVAFLRINRCDVGQGYLFSEPLPAPACTAWLEGSRRTSQIVPAGDTAEVPAVLLVDDDADCLTLTQNLLAPDGYRILMASDARQALERLALDDVSVIVSDENMPGMPGVELLARVKIMYPHVARIMMTGETDFQTAAKAINEGEVCKFFVKQRDDLLLRNEVRRAYWAKARPGPYASRAGRPPEHAHAAVGSVMATQLAGSAP